MRRLFLLLAFTLAALSGVHAQRDNTVYVDQFPGIDLATKTANAQTQCIAGLKCVLIFNPGLGRLPVGSMPAQGANECWERFDTAAPYSTCGSVASGVAGNDAGGTNTQVQYNNNGIFGGFGSWNGNIFTIPAAAVTNNETVGGTLGVSGATTLSGALTTNITGPQQCVHALANGALVGTGTDCGSPSAGATATIPNIQASRLAGVSCTPANGVSFATCTSTLTWATAFPDTNYKVSCQGDTKGGGTPTNPRVIVQGYQNKTTTSVDVVVETDGSSTDNFGDLSCFGSEGTLTVQAASVNGTFSTQPADWILSQPHGTGSAQVVQSTQVEFTGSSQAITLPKTTTSGNALFVAILETGTSAVINSITASTGTVLSNSISASTQFVYFNCNITGGAETITVTESASHLNQAIVVAEVSGATTTNCIDKTTSGFGSNPATAAVTQANEIFLSFLGETNNGVPSVGTSGWTLNSYSSTVLTGTVFGALASKSLNNASGTVTHPYSNSSGSDVTATITVFAATTNPPQPVFQAASAIPEITLTDFWPNVTPSGDCTIALTTGVITCAQLNGANFQVNTSGTPTKIGGIVTAGQGVPIIQCRTLQKAESAADASVLSCTPAAAAGTYRIRFVMSVSAASSATLGWTATWTDSNGNAQAPTNLALNQTGVAAAALTFTTSAAGNYQADMMIDVNSAGTAIVIKLTFSGTSFAGKVSATVERIL